MKRLLIMFLYVCCLSACSADTSLEGNTDGQSVAAMPESLYMELYPGNGWALTIMRDGSGSFSFGSLPTDVAYFPAETLIYTEVYSAVVPQLQQDKSAFKDTAVGVIVSRKEQSSYVASYFDGASYWNGLVDTLRTKLTAYNQQRFDAIRTENPLKIEIKE